MLRFRDSVGVLLLLLASSVAIARTSVPVVNIEGAPIVAAQGKALTLDDVNRAIVEAGKGQGYPWVVKSSAPGKLVLSTFVRNKHTVVVEVTFDTQAYSIRYADSTNMNHAVKSGKDVIHPNYNAWVTELRQAIDAQLLRA